MKVYIKRDKVLKLIGEGNVYSKKDLVLKEGNGYTVDANSSNQQINNSGNAITAMKKAANMNPNGTSTLDGGDIGPEKTTTNNAGDNSSIEVGPSVKPTDIDKISKDFPAAKIVYNKNAGKTNNNGVQLASVTPRKVMDEMRKNSIPFTKLELTEFLKTI